MIGLTFLTGADEALLAEYAFGVIMVGAGKTLCLFVSVSVSINATSSFTCLIIRDFIVTVLRTTCVAACNRIIRPTDRVSEG